tara:strand:+ start:673 stop:897 length:225 start_codon:yes stop_codon:yes gene_type:complete
MPKVKLPEHLKGKTPHDITNYIMGGIVREPEPETIGEFFSRLARDRRAREGAAVRALLERFRRDDPDPTSAIKL